MVVSKREKETYLRLKLKRNRGRERNTFHASRLCVLPLVRISEMHNFLGRISGMRSLLERIFEMRAIPSPTQTAFSYAYGKELSET